MSESKQAPERIWVWSDPRAGLQGALLRVVVPTIPEPPYIEYVRADQVATLTAELAALRANNQAWIAANGPGGWVDALRADAERYRLLRKELEGEPWHAEVVFFLAPKHADQDSVISGAELDAAIDAIRTDQPAAAPEAQAISTFNLRDPASLRANRVE